MKTAAVVPAAGSGARMNRSLPKQFLPLGGIPIIARTLGALAGVHIIDAILPVLDMKDFDYCQEDIIRAFSIKKIICLAEGGRDRQESVYNGLKRISRDFDIILVHDAVRPFVEAETVLEIIAQAAAHGAAAAAVPVTDTIKKAGRNGFISRTVPRAGLWSAQTPQAFRREIILNAHERAEKDGFKGTDDASLVERLGKEVRIVESSPWNIKITTAEDFVAAEGILRELGLP